MKRNFFLLFALLICGSAATIPAMAQAPAQFQTAFQAIPTNPGGRNFATADMQAIDAAGNLYGIIKYRGDFSMGLISVTGADTAQHQFLVKIDPAGRAIWTSAITSSWPYCWFQIVLSPAGDVFMSGVYVDDISFNGLAGTTTLNSGGGARDYYLAKWSSTGFLQWARNGGGDGWRFLYNLTADNQGNCYLTGDYWFASQFPSQSGTQILTPFNASWGFGSAFCLKYSASGNLVWLRDGANQDSTSSNRGSTIRTDQAGRVYLLGGGRGNALWGTQTLPTAASGNWNNYWLRLDPATGDIVRSFMTPSGSQDWMTIDVDAAGYSYLAGDYRDSINVGGVTLLDTIHGHQSAYLARFDPDGALQWVHNLTTASGFLQGYHLTADRQGKVYLMGTTRGPLLADGVSIVPGVATLRDINGFIAAFDQTLGLPQWGLPVGGPTVKAITKAAVNDRGEILAQVSSQQDSVFMGNLRLDSNPSREFGVRIVQQYNTLRGEVFTDSNRNGVRDAAEDIYRYGAVLQTVPQGFYFTTAADGTYDAFVDLGSNAVQLPNPPRYYTALATGITTPAVFTSYGRSASERNFALQPIAGQQDVRVSLTPVGRARPGFPVKYRVTYRNIGTVVLPAGNVALTLDPLLAYLSNTGGGTLANSTLTVTYAGLLPGQTRNFDVLCQLPTTAPLGDTLVSVAAITPLTGDLTPADNTETSRLRVTGSFDPNDIEVNYVRLTPQQVAGGEWLEYTIRFQNMGTDTAFSILLRDSLPEALLNLGTLQLIASSHSCTWGISPGALLNVLFTSIRLPHRAVNTIGSNGFVRFRVRPRGTLVIGDLIPNRAEIHFDFNAPITTNTALTTIDHPAGLLSAAASLAGGAWPNPTSGQLHVEASLPAVAALHLTLLDAVGRPVREQTAPAATGLVRETLDVRGLAAGLYLLRAQAGAASFTRRVVVK